MAKKDLNYYDMFEQGIAYCLKGAKALQKLLDENRLVEEEFAAIKKTEQDADSHMHTVCEYLNVAFITPIDRDDIYQIAKETDDIIDSIDSVAANLWMMNVTEVTMPMRTMADLIVKACEELAQLMSELHRGKKSNRLYELIIDINRIEEVGDRCYKEALRELFTREKDPIALMKLHKVYDELENALDNCEDVANCVESIIITKT